MKKLLAFFIAGLLGCSAAFGRNPEIKLASADRVLNELWHELSPELRQELRSSEIAFIHQRDSTIGIDEKLELTEQRVNYLLRLQPIIRIGTKAELERLRVGTKYLWVPDGYVYRKRTFDSIYLGQAN